MRKLGSGFKMPKLNFNKQQTRTEQTGIKWEKSWVSIHGPTVSLGTCLSKYEREDMIKHLITSLICWTPQQNAIVSMGLICFESEF